MKLIWSGHSCFKLESALGSVVLDPYAPDYVDGLALPAELTADEVICSHTHADHGYERAVTRTGNEVSFKVMQLACFHDEVQGAKRGKNLITVIDAEGLRIVHMGDIGHTLPPEQISALGEVDVLLIPVGGYYTVDAHTAKEIADSVKPRVTIPMHYRGAGFGFDVLSTVDDYLALCDNVHRVDGNVVTLPYMESGVTLALTCPTK